jgi:hypothetical protein
MTAPGRITVRIDRLVLQTDHPVDAFALRRALGEAVCAVLVERGVPEAWHADVRRPVAVIDGLAWDGQGGEPALARAVASKLYEGVLS